MFLSRTKKWLNNGSAELVVNIEIHHSFCLSFPPHIHSRQPYNNRQKPAHTYSIVTVC